MAKLMTTIGGVRYRLEDARARGLLDDKNKLTDTGKDLDKVYAEAHARRVARHENNPRRRGVSNRTRPGTEVPVEIPEGDPAESWTVAQLDAYAVERGVEVSGNKGEKLAALAAAAQGEGQADGGQ